MKISVSVLVLSLCLLVVNEVRAESIHWIDAAPNVFNSLQVKAISLDGDSVVGTVVSASIQHAFVWTKSLGISSIGFESGGFSDGTALGTSNYATVVVGTGSVMIPSTESDTNLAFRWSQSDGVGRLGDMPSLFYQSRANAVSGDGRVVAGARTLLAGTEAFVWTAEMGMIGLNDELQGSSSSTALGISEDGVTIIGLAKRTGSNRAFRWNPENGAELLKPLVQSPSVDSVVISPDGNHSYGNGPFFVTHWNSDGDPSVVDNGTSGNTLLEVRAASIHGSTLVGIGYSVNSPLSTAMIWQEGLGTKSIESILLASGIELDGWNLYEAMSVSRDGRVIIGNALNSQGRVRGWLVDLTEVPEPDTLLQAVMAIFAIAAANARYSSTSAESIRCQLATVNATS